MRTSPSRFSLSEHTAEPIPKGTLGYIRARSKRRIFTVLLEEFERSGITKAQLARRLNMDPSLVGRYLGTPANWEHETLVDFFFAISGAVLVPTLAYPLREKPTAEIIIFDPQKGDPRPSSGTSQISGVARAK